MWFMSYYIVKQELDANLNKTGSSSIEIGNRITNNHPFVEVETMLQSLNPNLMPGDTRANNNVILIYYKKVDEEDSNAIIDSKQLASRRGTSNN